VCAVPNHEFILPHLGNTTGDLLLWSLFDLIRHGLTHQYQQIIVTLIDNKSFSELFGASECRFLVNMETFSLIAYAAATTADDG